LYTEIHWKLVPLKKHLSVDKSLRKLSKSAGLCAKVLQSLNSKRYYVDFMIFNRLQYFSVSDIDLWFEKRKMLSYLQKLMQFFHFYPLNYAKPTQI
jgi:hypothetical protein